MKSPAQTSSTARIITIGGGKGGVGKSIVSSNLAVAMAQSGQRVVLVDCDLGAANQHVLFGIDRPVPGLQALLDRKITSLEPALTPTPHPNLHLIAGTGASVGAANISHGEKQRIMKKIRALGADVVIVDVGAGVSFNVLDFFELGSQRLLVVTPQVTSIQTAYSFLKGAVLRTLRHHAEKNDEIALLEPAITSKENEKVSNLLARLRTEHPEFAEAVFKVLSRFNAQIIGNQVFEQNQTGIFHAVSRMISDFLGISVPILGYVGVSKRIRESVNQRKPMLLSDIKDENAKVFREMAEALLLEDVQLDDLLIEEEDIESVAPDAAVEVAERTQIEAGPSAAHIDAERTSIELSANGPSESGAGEGETNFQAEYNPYARKHFRHVVDWTSSLARGKTAIGTVRVHEISAGGAAIESSERLEIGDRLTLVFENLEQRPSVYVTVARRIPQGFALEGEMPATVVAAATANPGTGKRMAG
ncbi:MAG TPA: P-loop NTPase [Polyangia bacterium]|nr:P-loop NTPase [Polyangia bacterium]